MDGTIRPEKLEEEGSIVELTARLICNGESVKRRRARQGKKQNQDGG